MSRRSGHRFADKDMRQGKACLPLSGVSSFRSSRRSPRRCAPAGSPTPARASSRSSGRRATSPAATTRWCTARAPISSGSTAARNWSSSISTKPADKALLEAMIARADVFVQNLKPGAVGEARLRDRAAAPRLSAPDRLLDLRLRRERALCAAQGLRPADPGGVRPRLGHRRAGGAGARRRLGGRRRDRHERLRGDPRGADRRASAPGRARRSRSRCSTPWRTG